MVQVMDPSQASGQIQLFTELHSRFPEVPTDVVKFIMQQSFSNRERCIELLAKECQKYQTPVTSPLACHNTEDLWQQRNCDTSSESISSMSSGHSVGTPSSGLTNQDVAHPLIRSSQSYPYIPPTKSGHVHNPTPRSSLPMASLDTVPPGHHVRALNGGSPATGAAVLHDPLHFRPDAQMNWHWHPPSSKNAAGMLTPESFSQYPRGALGQDGRAEAGGSLLSCNLPGGSPNAFQTSKQKTVTSEVRYRVSPSGFTGEWAGPTYSSTTSVSMMAPEERCSPSVSSRHSSNAYINPQQAWVRNPLKPTTYVSSLSSSCECLPSVTGASEASVQQSSSCLPAHSTSTVSPRRNSNSPRSGNEDVDNPEYINALRVCQTVRLEKQSQKHQEFVWYCNELRSCIARLESEITRRLLLRSQAFPTAEDVEKLKQDNRKLRVDIQLLTREIDLANDGQMLLGVLDPVEQERYRRESSQHGGMSRSISEASSGASVISPVPLNPGFIPPLTCPLPVPPVSEPLSSSQQSDDTEDAKWSCSACTFDNYPALKQCEMCEMPRIPSTLR